MGQRQIWHVEKKKFYCFGFGDCFWGFTKTEEDWLFITHMGQNKNLAITWQSDKLINHWSLEGILVINLINKVVDLVA